MAVLAALGTQGAEAGVAEHLGSGVRGLLTLKDYEQVLVMRMSRQSSPRVPSAPDDRQKPSVMQQNLLGWLLGQNTQALTGILRSS